MKVAVLTICYNEEETLGAVLQNWHGKVWKHVVLHTDKPWHGQELPHDKSEEICKGYRATFIRLPWKGETEQRNWGLGYLYDCDYVLIVDADELYTEADQFTILETLGKSGEEFNDNFDCYRIPNIKTYFKTPDHVLDPPDTHKPVIAINPKRRLFTEHRLPSSDYQIPIDVTMHHLTYLRSDLRLYHKLRQFEHHDAVKKNWYTEVWKNWSPDSVPTEAGLRAYGQDKSQTVLDPMPEEIRALLT